MEAKRKQEEKTQETPGNEKNSLVLLEIEKAKKAGMNMLLPSSVIEGLAEFHSPVIDYEQLSPEPTDGDVYFHTESGKFAPTKQGLMKLALCAGIIWDPVRHRRTDNRGDRNYVSFQAVAGVRKADGSLVWLPAEYDMDFEVIEDKLQKQYRKKANEQKSKTEEQRQEYVDYCVRRDLLYKREHKVKLCETGAMNRVIRMLLVGLKAGYSKAELKKPFVVARIVFKPDYSDPQIRDLMIRRGIDSMTSIYGGESAGEIHGEPLASDFSDITPLASDVSKMRQEKPKSPPQENDEPEDKTGDGNITNAEADFMASDDSSQISTLKALAKRKDYDLKQLKRPLDKFTEAERKGFFDKLMGMPDSDIPF